MLGHFAYRKRPKVVEPLRFNKDANQGRNQDDFYVDARIPIVPVVSDDHVCPGSSLSLDEDDLEECTSIRTNENSKFKAPEFESLSFEQPIHEERGVVKEQSRAVKAPKQMSILDFVNLVDSMTPKDFYIPMEAVLDCRLSFLHFSMSSFKLSCPNCSNAFVPSFFLKDTPIGGSPVAGEQAKLQGPIKCNKCRCVHQFNAFNVKISFYVNFMDTSGELLDVRVADDHALDLLGEARSKQEIKAKCLFQKVRVQVHANWSDRLNMPEVGIAHLSVLGGED